MVTLSGEIKWEDDVPGDNRESGRDAFLRLDEGSNEMRLVTHPYQQMVHKYKKEGDQGFGQKIPCSKIKIPGSEEFTSCPLCEAGDRAKPRWLIGVISRKTGTYKILDISYSVFSQIRKLARNTQRWGDPTKYDIDIVVDKKGGATGYYSVQPISKEPLNATDQQIKDNVDLDDLKRRVTPPTAEYVQKRIDRINGVEQGEPVRAASPPSVKNGGGSAHASVKTAKPAAKVQHVVLPEDDDEEFQNYEDDT
jgi:hypothetical protein